MQLRPGRVRLNDTGITEPVYDDAGQPVEGAQVTANQSLTSVTVQTVSTADGSFALRDVPAGRYLSAFVDGFPPAKFVHVAAPADAPGDAADEGPTPLRLQLPPPGGDVTVTVLDAQGRAVADAFVYVGKPMPPAPRQAQFACDLQPPWLGRTDDTRPQLVVEAHLAVLDLVLEVHVRERGREVVGDLRERQVVRGDDPERAAIQ